MRQTTGPTPIHSPGKGPLTRKFFIDNAEIQLRTWETRLGQIAGEAKVLTADSRAIIEGRMRELSAKLATAHEQLDEIKEMVNEQWDEVKAAFDVTWDQITEIFNRTDPPRAAVGRAERKH